MSKNKKDKTSKTPEEKLASKIEKLTERGQSDLCEVRNSDIHGRGVYAAKDLKQGDRIIEYVGEKIDKEESERRAWAQHARATEHGEASVYIFTLSKKWDIDGNFEWNPARLINHSCSPNCESWIEGKRIFVYATREIKKGEELTFDYGFDIECYEDHPCRCGSKNCVGYIVIEEQWPELEKRLAAKRAEEKVAKVTKKKKSAPKRTKKSTK